MPADLLVIVPSRGRPHNIAALHDAWSETTTGVSELLVAADDDDPALSGYEQVCAERGIELAVGPRLRMVPTLNKVAIERAPRHYAVGFLGDDHRPRTLGFDAHYLAALRTLGTGWVYGNDLLAGERLPTQVAMTSDIVQALGAMVPAPVTHLYADNTWWDLGHALDRITYLPDVIVEHMHYLNGKSEIDPGYREANASAAAESDRRIYARWYADQMSLDAEKLRSLIA